jgi:peptidylprolyl isomerase
MRNTSSLLFLCLNLHVSMSAQYGAIGLLHEVGDYNGGSAAFFWLPPDRSKSLQQRHMEPAVQRLNYKYALFAYVVDGIDVLEQLREGDVLVSAQVEDGVWDLQTPSGDTEVIAIEEESDE